MRPLILMVVLLAVLSLTLSGCGGPSEAEEHYNAGVELQEEGRLEEAIAEYDEAIRLDPQLTAAYLNRGNTYYNLGQFQRAIQDYDEALRLDPQYANAYANRALTYTLLGDDVAARRDADRAVELGFDRALLNEKIEELKRQR